MPIRQNDLPDGLVVLGLDSFGRRKMLIAMEGPLLKDTESSGYPSGLHRILQCQGSGHERQNLTTKV